MTETTPWKQVLSSSAVRSFVTQVVDCTNGDLVVVYGPRTDGHGPAELLGNALDTGLIDEAIKWQDRHYGWLNYTQFDPDQQYLEGSFAVPGATFALTPLTSERYVAWLRRLVRQPGPPAGKCVSEADAGALIARFLRRVQGKNAVVRTWRIEPNFLRSSDGELVPESGGLAYFESAGWNAAVVAVGASAWYLLLLNAYPGRAAYDPHAV